MTPPFGDEPTDSPFGDEPQAPRSSADPLSAPFDDDPPAPPDDELPKSPASGEALPLPFEPSPRESRPAPFDEDGPPVMPADDPFKDDPDPPFQGSQRRQIDRDYLAVEQRLAISRGTSTRATANRHDTTLISEPRLLRADGQSLHLNPPAHRPATDDEQSRLRQVSHPIKRTAHAEPELQAVDISATIWRQNPLRPR